MAAMRSAISAPPSSLMASQAASAMNRPALRTTVSTFVKREKSSSRFTFHVSWNYLQQLLHVHIAAADDNGDVVASVFYFIVLQGGDANGPSPFDN